VASLQPYTEIFETRPIPKLSSMEETWRPGVEHKIKSPRWHAIQTLQLHVTTSTFARNRGSISHFVYLISLFSSCVSVLCASCFGKTSTTNSTRAFGYVHEKFVYLAMFCWFRCKAELSANLDTSLPPTLVTIILDYSFFDEKVLTSKNNSAQRSKILMRASKQSFLIFVFVPGLTFVVDELQERHNWSSVSRSRSKFIFSFCF